MKQPGGRCKAGPRNTYQMKKYLYILTDGHQRADVRLMDQLSAQTHNELKIPGNPWTWRLMHGADFQGIQTHGVEPILGTMHVLKDNPGNKKALTALLEGAMKGFNRDATPWHYWHAFAPILSAHGYTLTNLEAKDQGHTDRVFVEARYKDEAGKEDTIDLCNEFNK